MIPEVQSPRIHRATMVPAGTQSLTTSTGLVQYSYDKHEVSMTCPGGPLDLETLDQGTTFTFHDFKRAKGSVAKRREEELIIAVTKRDVAPDRALFIHFELRLRNGGGAMAFMTIGTGHCTTKGEMFCGRSAGHVVFEKLIRPLLEGDVTVMEKRGKEVQVAWVWKKAAESAVTCKDDGTGEQETKPAGRGDALV